VSRTDLGPSEWAVLALCDEEPAHGFALARALDAAGPVGRVWAVPRPMVYRALRRLRELGLVEDLGTSPGTGGPPKTIFAATPQARAEVDEWLQQPVQHIRDARYLLLLKLLFLHRRGRDATPLVGAQADAYRAVQERLRESGRHADDDFDRVILAWRLESARAALRFLDGLGVSR